MGLFFGKKKKKNYEIQDAIYEDVNFSGYMAYEEEIEDTGDRSGVDDEYEENISQLTDKNEKLLFVEDCCEQILEASRRIVETKKEYQAVNGYLDDIRIMKEMDEKQKEKLQAVIRRIRNLRQDKDNYRNYTQKMPESKYNYFRKNEKNMQTILKDIHDDEMKLQSLKTDLNHIEGEKAGLLYERKMYKGRISGIRNGVVAILLGGLMVMGIFSYYHLNSDYDMTIALLLTVAVLVASMAGLLVFYQNTVRDTRLNEKKMNKVVGLLNKYRLLYVNVQSRVDYIYKKLEINSSYELSSLWGSYLTLKKEQEVYAKVSDELYQEQKLFQDMIHALQLYDESVWGYQMDAILDPACMWEIQDNLEKRKKGLRKTLDYNQKRSNKCKQKVKNMIHEEPKLAADILRIVESKEKEISA